MHSTQRTNLSVHLKFFNYKRMLKLKSKHEYSLFKIIIIKNLQLLKYASDIDKGIPFF